MAQRPNVLLFFTDDQRFNTIHALGNDQIRTPNLDALVARGTTFTRAHIPGGTCGAVCMPSRAMLHTGRTLFHLDREGQQIPESHITLGESFRGAGYTTFGTGKWHNGSGAYARSFSCGDEIFFGGMGDHWNVPAHHFDPTGRYDRVSPQIIDPFRGSETRYWHCDHIEPGYHSTDLFVDAASSFVRGHDTTDPFFLYVSLMAPHDPRVMPEKFLKMYDPQDIALPDNFTPEHAFDTGALRIRDEMLAAFPRNPDEIKRHIAEYYAMITHLDDAFGSLVAALDEKGELDNTIIVFAGDNGLALGQHGLMGKQSSYEHSVRVPLVMAGPGIPEGSRSDALAYLLDIYPTLCELTGMDTPASVEGESLKQCIEDPAATHRKDLYLAYEKSIRGVTDGKHKLIEYACGETQLFDLANDPLEMHSLANEAGLQDTLTGLRGRLLELSTDWDDRAHPTGEAFWGQRKDLMQ
jgi:arylsulfatase A-like enzyme